jgi:VanZ family protein
MSAPAATARWLLIAYVALIGYATLYPFVGWRDQGLSPFAFLSGWPRNWLWYDWVSNAMAYTVLGGLGVLSLYPRLKGWRAVLLAAWLASALSLVLEALQTYLPARVPSLSDWTSNTLGALVGALLAVPLCAPLITQGRFVDWRHRWIESHDASHRVGAGLTLLALWLFAQLYPTGMLFGSGFVAAWVGLDDGVPFTPAQFVIAEAAVTACQVIAAGLIAAAVVAPPAWRRPVAALLAVALGLAAKSLALASLFKPEHAWLWQTPGALSGLAWGAALLLMAVWLPQPVRMMVLAVAVTFATVVVNVSPANPYYQINMLEWNQGRFLNFNGMTRMVSTAWPYLALGYVLFVVSRRNASR